MKEEVKQYYIRKVGVGDETWILYKWTNEDRVYVASKEVPTWDYNHQATIEVVEGDAYTYLDEINKKQAEQIIAAWGVKESNG